MSLSTLQIWRLVLPILLLSGASSHASSSATDGHGADIVNGNQDLGDPAVVAIATGCTGAVIAPRVVLTAKHCVSGASPARLAVFFGNDIHGPGTTIDAIGTVLHPSADLAVIMLASNAPAAALPVSFEELQAHVGEPVRAVGFGVTSETGPADFGLKRQGTTQLDHVDADLMYIGVDPSMAWTCYGDSGGPRFMTIGGLEKIVGITSFGTGACGEPADAGTRTDTHGDWIGPYVNLEPDPGPGAGDISSGCSATDPPAGAAVWVLAIGLLGRARRARRLLAAAHT